MKKQTDPRERGFTLIEMMITLLVLVSATVAVATILDQVQMVYSNQNESIERSQQLRSVLNVITRTCRQAGNDPTESLAVPPVEPLEAEKIRINSDLTGSVASTTGNAMESTGDPDGTLSSIYEQVTIWRDADSNELMIDVGYGDEVLAEEISSFQLSYSDAFGNPTEDPTVIARVAISLTGQSDQRDGNTGSLTLASAVYIRSRTVSIFE